MKKRTSNFAEMNYFLFFCCLVLGIGTAQNTEAQITAWPAPAFVDSVRNPVPFGGAVMEDAKKIYNTTCWTCHGLDGKGTGPASVQMNPKPADHTSATVLHQSDGALFWKISVGKGNMQPYSKLLTVKQRWALVNYIRSLSSGNGKSGFSQTNH